MSGSRKKVAGTHETSGVQEISEAQVGAGVQTEFGREKPESAAAVSTVERDQAISDLEGAFASLTAAFRRFYVESANTVSPGLPLGALKTLVLIHRDGPVTLSSLVQRLHTDKGQVSRHIADLEKLNLVERTPDSRDARSRPVQITRLGARRLELARKPHVARLHSILDSVPVSTIDEITTILVALSQEP